MALIKSIGYRARGQFIRQNGQSRDDKTFVIREDVLPAKQDVREYLEHTDSRHRVTKRDDLPSAISNLNSPEESIILPANEKTITLSEMEKLYILKTLETYEWNQKKAAGKLGIGRTTLWRKLNQYGIVAPKRGKGAGTAKSPADLNRI